jgi:glyoxylase-like metal-dependent hydrolase (beta-lactamase superfamily II)
MRMTDRSALEYPFDTPPASGEIRQVAPGIAWLRMPLPYVLDHINLWMLDDDRGVAIIDTGIGNEITRTFWDRIFTQHLNGRTVTRVLITHLHPDHAGNAGWLTERFKVPLTCSQGDFLMAHAWRDQSSGYQVDALVDLFRHHGLDEDSLTELDATRGTAYRRAVPRFPERYQRLIDGDMVRIGSTDWQVIMGYGHAPEHASLYSAERKVLIAGDMILPRISTNVSVSAVSPEGNPLKRFIDSVKVLGRLPDDTFVLPSHGLPFYGLQLRARQLVEHHDARFLELEAACAKPRIAAELIPILFRRKLDAQGLFFAMGETLAHLNYLVEAGRMRREPAPGDRTRYVAV